MIGSLVQCVARALRILVAQYASIIMMYALIDHALIDLPHNPINNFTFQFSIVDFLQNASIIYINFKMYQFQCNTVDFDGILSLSISLV